MSKDSIIKITVGLGADLPTPESDPTPEFTKFILEAGEIYDDHLIFRPLSSYQKEQYRQKKLNTFFAKYFNKNFIDLFKKEFKVR